jgi:AcrR family transcriptional regulator
VSRDPEIDALRRRRITDAAARLFAVHGFDAVTVDQIAAAAPCSKRTLYARFASKEAIRLAIVADEFEHFAAFAAGLVAATGHSAPRDSFTPGAGGGDAARTEAPQTRSSRSDARRSGEEILAWLAERHRAEPYRAGAALAFSLDPADSDLLQDGGRPGRGGDERRGLLARIVEAGDRLEDGIARVIAVGQRDGALRPGLDPAVTGMALWASISALVQMAASKAVYLESRYGLGPEGFLAAGMDLIWNGIAAPAAAPAVGLAREPEPAVEEPR